MKFQPYLHSFYRVLLILIFGFFSLGQLQRFEFVGNRAIYLHEIAITLFIFIFLFANRSTIFAKFRKNKILQLFSLFNVWVLFTSIFLFHTNFSQLLNSFLYLARLDTLIIFGIALYTLVQQKILNRIYIKTLLILAISLIAWFGFLQYFFIPDTRFLRLLGWDDHYLRLISTIFDPGFTGILLSIGSLILVKDVGECESNSKEVCIPFSCTKKSFLFTLCFLALLFTYSRASYLAFFAGLIYLFILYRKKPYLFLIGIFIVGMFVLPRPKSEGARLERTASIVARLESTQQATQDITPLEFLIGKGWYYLKQTNIQSVTPDGITVPNHASAPDNSFLFIFRSLGIVGIALVGSFLFLCIKLAGKTSDFTLALVAVSIHSLFSNTLFYTFVLLTLAIIMGYIAPSLQPLSRLKHR